MREIKNVKDVQKITFSIMKRVDEICNKNSVVYYAVGGTLLGAVRHRGFIPWDDDIDIAIFRKDVDKFINAINGSNSGLYCCSFKDDCYYYNFLKVVDIKTTLCEKDYYEIPNMGIFVDVFIIDDMPSKWDEAIAFYKKIASARKKIKIMAIKPVMRKNIILFLKTVIKSIQNRNKTITKYQNKYIELVKTFENSPIIYVSGGSYGTKDMFDRKVFGDPTFLPFEDMLLSCPTDSNAYLKRLYGDYMQLPPIEKRKSHHNFVAYYKEGD